MNLMNRRALCIPVIAWHALMWMGLFRPVIGIPKSCYGTDEFFGVDNCVSVWGHFELDQQWRIALAMLTLSLIASVQLSIAASKTWALLFVFCTSAISLALFESSHSGTGMDGKPFDETQLIAAGFVLTIPLLLSSAWPVRGCSQKASVKTQFGLVLITLISLGSLSLAAALIYGRPVTPFACASVNPESQGEAIAGARSFLAEQARSPGSRSSMIGDDQLDCGGSPLVVVHHDSHGAQICFIGDPQKRLSKPDQFISGLTMSSGINLAEWTISQVDIPWLDQMANRWRFGIDLEARCL